MGTVDAPFSLGRELEALAMEKSEHHLVICVCLHGAFLHHLRGPWDRDCGLYPLVPCENTPLFLQRQQNLSKPYAPYAHYTGRETEAAQSLYPTISWVPLKLESLLGEF